jgi:hypothetical protein
MLLQTIAIHAREQLMFFMPSHSSQLPPPSPLYDPNSERAKALFNCEAVIVVAFTGEMVLRMIALARCPAGQTKGAFFSLKRAARTSGRWEPLGYFYTGVGGYNW